MSSPNRKKLVIKDVDQRFNNICNANKEYRGYGNSIGGYIGDNYKEDLTQSSSKKDVFILSKIRGDITHKIMSSKKDIDNAFYDTILNRINDEGGGRSDFNNNIHYAHEPMTPAIYSNSLKKNRKATKSKPKSKKEKSAKSIQHIFAPDYKEKQHKLEIETETIEIGNSSELPLSPLKSPSRSPPHPFFSPNKRTSPKVFTMKSSYNKNKDTQIKEEYNNIHISKMNSNIIMKKDMNIFQQHQNPHQHQKRNSYFFLPPKNQLTDDMIVKVAEIEYNSISELKEVNSIIPLKDNDNNKGNNDYIINNLSKDMSKKSSNHKKQQDDNIVEMKNITQEQPVLFERKEKEKENNSAVVILDGCVKNDNKDKRISTSNEKDSSECKLSMMINNKISKKRKLWFCCFPGS